MTPTDAPARPARAFAATTTTMTSPASLVVEFGEPFLHSCVISLRGLTSVPRATVSELAKAIAHHGGAVVMDDDGGDAAVAVRGEVTHAAVEDASATLGDAERNARVVSAEWIRACLSAKTLLDVDSNVLYVPPRSVAGLEAFKDCVVCVTGYNGQRRRDVETMVKVLGGTYQKVFDRGVTHLVAFEFSGAKWERARGWTTAKIVNHRWLEECVRRWARVDEAAFGLRSGKEEDELANAVPDSEDEDGVEDATRKELSVVPDSMGTTTTSTMMTARANASSADANAFTSQLETAPLTLSAKKKVQTPSAVKEDNKRSASKSASKGAAWRSPDWVEEERRGARVAVSKRSRIDPKYKEALQGNCTQPEDMFHGLVGSPDDVEKAFGGRYAPNNAWFSFFEDAEAEPLTDAPNVDEFCTLLASGRGRVENEDNETRMARIRNGEIRFDVFDQGISERQEEEILREGNGLCMRTLYSGTVILLDESLRNDCEGIIKFVDDLEMQQKQGPLGAWIQAMIRVETAKQPVVGERVRAGADALLTTFLTYMHLAHSFQGTDYAQLFNGDGSFASADKVITLPARKPGNLAGVVLAPVDRTVRDVVAGYYELLAGPSEPDPTQRPASQLVPSGIGEEEDEERVNEEEPVMAPVEDFAPEQEERVENQAPEPERRGRDASKASTSKDSMTKTTRKTATTTTNVVAKAAKAPSKPKTKPTVTKAATPAFATKAYVALSGFSSVDIKKYSTLVRRLGAILCSGHEWEPSTTHVVFGARGSRSIKFLAGAISGAHLVDESFLVECASAGKIVDVRDKHLWRGGRGAEMGVIDAQATKHWSTVAPHSAFKGLSIALLPFEPSAKIDRAMLDVVLRAGGASLSSVSSKGDVCLTQAEVPDIVITDHADVRTPTAVPRLAPLIDACAGGVLVVTPEFFKSWISTPGALLDAHCLFGASASTSENDAVIDALSKRGACVTVAAPAAPASPHVDDVNTTKTKTKNAQPTKAKARQTPARAEKPAEQAVLLSQRQTRAKRAENAPLAERVGKRRRALKDSN
uniref:BRCT domain-containing protein n=2 Tax=Ostreococcus mediterraneus TaxID=1486918 RepID=A0A7S0KMH4_9CHLO